MDVRFSLAFPREALSLQVMRRVLGDALGALGIAPDCVSDILLAVTEACTNVLLHGGAARTYEVMARVGGSRCVLEVVETGSRLDPWRNLRGPEDRRSVVHRPGAPRRTRPRTVGWLTWPVNRPRGWPEAGSPEAGSPEAGSLEGGGPLEGGGSLEGGGWPERGGSPEDGAAVPEQAGGENGPVANLPESGRGLQIMRALVDDITLRGGGVRATSVSMEKELTWRSDAPLAALPGTGLRRAG